MSSNGAAPRAAVPVSNARAEASRRNGAKSRGPKTPAGKARAAQNALKHGMRAAKHVLLPQEDATEFEALEGALLAELAPVGALQTVLARRIAMAAWRLARADRMEAEVLEFRSYEGANAGLALMRDGNATRSFETLMRYRSAAMAEFTRALRTLQALQAEQRAAELPAAAPAPVRARPPRGSQTARRLEPSEPERRPESPSECRLEYFLPASRGPDRALHEAALPWTPNEPEPAAAIPPAPAVPVARHERAAGSATAGALTPPAEGGGRRTAPRR